MPNTNDLQQRYANLSPDKRALVALRLSAEPGADSRSRSAKCLVAYLVLDTGQEPSNSSMLQFLRRRLPDYMLPAKFVRLDALPLTPNGKVDRLALPAAGTARPEPEISYVPPRTPVEETLAEIWSKVLKIDRVGVMDSFFDLGGHSLLAIQVVSRIRTSLHIEIPLRTVFENVTLASLAAAIVRHQAEQIDHEEAAVLLKQVESLTDDEVESLLKS
jgi:surfactin family lipopeptide synthetase C